MRLTLLALLPAAFLTSSPLWASCSVEVAASIFPIASIVQEIGGDKVKVTTIIPAGADPHHFEISPRTARAIYDADAVFLIGDGFDRWAFGERLLERRAPLIVEFYESFEDSLMAIGDTFDPHFWLDPLFARVMGTIVEAVLSQLDPSNRSYYQARTKVFCSRIDSLHASVRARLRRSDLREFVSFHPAWSYYARRYRLRQIDTIVLSPEQEPSAKHIAGVIRKMRKTQVKFILADEFSNFDLARAIASESGAQIIVLDPLGGNHRPGRESYFELIGYNTSMIEGKGYPP